MNTEFCQFLDSEDKIGTIRLKPLGIAKNRVNSRFYRGGRTWLLGS